MVQWLEFFAPCYKLTGSNLVGGNPLVLGGGQALVWGNPW